jgi:WD40 repeat protein
MNFRKNAAPIVADDPRETEASPGADDSADGMQFDVFISYSRHDAAVADKIERDLERYPLPREVRKRLGRRHLNVFRDLSDMTGNRLGPALELHLLNSRTLVVLCSPAARRSGYVSLEINRFAELRDAERIVPALIGGGPNNDPNVDPADWAFPEALQDALGDGPLAADLTRAWNGRGRRAKVTRGSPWVQLVAGIVGSTTDDLTQRIARSERRRLQVITAIFTVVLAVSALAVFQMRRADQQALQAAATRLAEHSRTELTVSRAPDTVRAIQEALASQSLSPSADPGVMLRALDLTSDVNKVIITGRPMFSGVDVVPESIEMRELNPVFDVAFSPDGRNIATAGSQVRIWDGATGERRNLFDTNLFDMSIAFRPDGRRIVTGGAQLQIWDDAGTAIGKPLRGHEGPVVSVGFSPDGKQIVSGGSDSTVRLWDANTGAEIGAPMTGHSGIVNSVDFSPDGRRIVSGGADGIILTWDAGTQSRHGQPVDVGADVNAVAFLPDSRRVASGDNAGQVRISDSSTGAPAGIIASDRMSVTAIALSADGRRIAFSGVDPAIKLAVVEGGDPLGVAVGHTGPVTSLAFSRDGNRIVSSSHDGTVRIWNADNHRSGGRQVVGPASVDGAPPFAKTVAISPDSRRLVGGYADGTLLIFDTESGRPVRSPLKGHRGGIDFAVYSPDGHRIASAGSDLTVRIWDVDVGQPVGTPVRQHTGTIVQLVFSPDGRRVLSTSEDKTIRIWDAESGDPIGEPLQGYEVYFGNVAFSPDGHTIAAGGADHTLRLWDADSGLPIGAPLTGFRDVVSNVAFSPDGRHIVSSSFDTLRLWDAQTRQPVGEPRSDLNLFGSLAMSPTEDLFVTGGSKSIRRWSAATGDPIGDPMRAHDDAVGDIAITADGRFLATGSMDHTLRFWDLSQGRPIGDPLNAGTDSVASVVFSGDGRRILTMNIAPDETVSAWIWPGPAAWHDDLCNKLTYNMSRRQWAEWVSPDIDYRLLCAGLEELPE